jgi:hypothetical protein
MNLTQERLKEVLHYDPETGVFTWKVSLNSRIPVGSVAGCIVQHYRAIGIDGEKYRAHRLAFLYMTGRFPKDEVDHIFHDKDNNRWRFITEATRKKNAKNLSLSKANKTGYCGIYVDKGKFRAMIQHEYKKICCGRYDTIEDAVAAAQEKYKELGFHPNHGK